MITAELAHPGHRIVRLRHDIRFESTQARPVQSQILRILQEPIQDPRFQIHRQTNEVQFREPGYRVQISMVLPIQVGHLDCVGGRPVYVSLLNVQQEAQYNTRAVDEGFRLGCPVQRHSLNLEQWSTFFHTIFVSSHMYPENPEETQVNVGSMNMGCISDTARNRTHNLFRYTQEPIPLGHNDGQPHSTKNLKGVIISQAPPTLKFCFLKLSCEILIVIASPLE